MLKAVEGCWCCCAGLQIMRGDKRLGKLILNEILSEKGKKKCLASKNKMSNEKEKNTQSHNNEPHKSTAKEAAFTLVQFNIYCPKLHPNVANWSFGGFRWIFSAGCRRGNAPLPHSPNTGRQEGRAKGRHPLMRREDADASKEEVRAPRRTTKTATWLIDH